jgi:hypothetical protein
MKVVTGIELGRPREIRTGSGGIHGGEGGSEVILMANKTETLMRFGQRWTVQEIRGNIELKIGRAVRILRPYVLHKWYNNSRKSIFFPFTEAGKVCVQCVAYTW